MRYGRHTCFTSKKYVRRWQCTCVTSTSPLPQVAEPSTIKCLVNAETKRMAQVYETCLVIYLHIRKLAWIHSSFSTLPSAALHCSSTEKGTALPTKILGNYELLDKRPSNLVHSSRCQEQLVTTVWLSNGRGVLSKHSDSVIWKAALLSSSEVKVGCVERRNILEHIR